QERLAKLEAENAELVDRWIQLKQEEAARMNEANEFVETALKSKKHELTHGKSIKGEKVTQCIPPSVAVKKLNLHDGDINCIQINREGTLLVTGGNDKKVIISDASTGAVKTSLIGCMQAVMSVSFSLKGDLVMATSNDNSVKHTLTGHIGKVFSAKFTDSNRVISGSHDRTLKLWDLNKGYCVKTIFTLSSCNDLDLLDGDGTLIVSGHLDNNLRVWDTRSGNLVREVSGLHSGQISSVVVAPSESCFSSDGVYVASGSADGALYVWNSESAKVERVLKDHRSAVSGVVWSPRGGSIVFSAEKEKGVICWGSAA
ncbi:WD40-repeat-containing domain protein, partial [Chytriomyces sp. MP71]